MQPYLNKTIKLRDNIKTVLPNNFVSENNQPQVVNILAVVLLDINPVHVHEDVPDHDHGSLVVIPGSIEGLKEVVVECMKDIMSDLRYKIIGTSYSSNFFRTLLSKWLVTTSLRPL